MGEIERFLENSLKNMPKKMIVARVKIEEQQQIQALKKEQALQKILPSKLLASPKVF